MNSRCVFLEVPTEFLKDYLDEICVREDAPHNTTTVLTTAKISSWVPEGLTAKTDGLTNS
jgi:hypothetical protein